MSIIGVQRRMTELGRIRTGEKGAKGEPKKLSKFRLTSASRPILEAAARVYGGTVRSWQGGPDDGLWELYTETDVLDIMVPPVITAYSQSYEIWDAGGCTARCDGRWESIEGVECAHDIEHRDFKVTTRVSVILPKLPGLGTWRLETHGWNAAATLPASLDLLIQAGQRAQWLPATLRLEQRSQRTKIGGKPQTRRFVVPVIDIAGFTFEEMVALGTGSDEYAELPDGLPAQPGPSRPNPNTRVGRPELPPGPPLPPEAEAFSRPVERAFPIEQPAVEGAPTEPPVVEEVAEDQVPLGAPLSEATTAGAEEGPKATTTTSAPVGRVAFLGKIAAMGITPEVAAVRSSALFPGIPPKELSNEQRGELLADLSEGLLV